LLVAARTRPSRPRMGPRCGTLWSTGAIAAHGLVGKFLMVDLGRLTLGTFEHSLNEFKSVRVTRVVQDFYDSDPKRGFYGGGGIDARAQGKFQPYSDRFQPYHVSAT